MATSCTRLRDEFKSYPLLTQIWLRELAKDKAHFMPCPRIQHDRRSGETYAFFKQVPVSQCVRCKYGYDDEK